MAVFNINEDSHRRYNPLTDEWILVSPHRAKRPWQGQEEELVREERPKYDSSCYLCPTNRRVSGHGNPDYKSTYVFENDYSSLKNDVSEGFFSRGNLIKAESEKGICKVICFSPNHDLTLAEMEVHSIKDVVDLWQSEFINLSQIDYIQYVQIFENKGLMMGCSNPHPHGQIWAQSSVPGEPRKETQQQESYFLHNNKSLLSDYLEMELSLNERLVYENESFAVLVPFWAIWPFETIIISKRHIQHIGNMTEKEKYGFADAMKTITSTYDRLFNTSFPYSSGIHQAPTDGKEYKGWHFHMHFYPPLLRSATIKKFMVGYEMLANPQRDITPELSSRRLKEIACKKVEV